MICTIIETKGGLQEKSWMIELSFPVRIPRHGGWNYLHFHILITEVVPNRERKELTDFILQVQTTQPSVRS